MHAERNHAGMLIDWAIYMPEIFTWYFKVQQLTVTIASYFLNRACISHSLAPACFQEMIFVSDMCMCVCVSVLAPRILGVTWGDMDPYDIG